VNRVTIAAIAFLAFAVLLSIWLLNRPSAPKDDESAAPSQGPRSGWSFAEWSSHSDNALLADIDPGKGASTLPRKFLVLRVKRGDDGAVTLEDGPTYSWAPADRAESAGHLHDLGFRVSTEDLAFHQPDDPLWSDPILKVDGGTEQQVTLRAKGSGISATFTRHRADPHSAPYWNRRAIGFASNDSHLVYVTPDSIVISAESPR
jgi:hypothetical protein